jgi:opacity protein-like surface antigen
MISRKLSIVMAAALVVVGATVARAGAPDTEVDVEAPAPVAVTETVAVETEEPSPFGGKAVYFMAGGVYAFENDTHFDGAIEGGSGGYDLRAGYDLHEMASLELEWMSLLSFSRDSVDPVTGNEDPDVEARMLSLNGKFSPCTSRFQPYALMGMGWYNVQADQAINQRHLSSFAMRFGLGVAAFITPRLGFNLEAGYVLPLTGDLGGGDRFDVIPITASLFYRFT